MAIDMSPLSAAPRLLFDVPVEAVQGSRFQPTGFPDLGAATYQSGDTDCLLVESAQSMANRLEATVWDSGTNELKSVARGLSYVRVNDEKGAFLTASIVEAHRLNSVYIEKSGGSFFSKELVDAIAADKKRPVDRARFARAVLRYDVNSLLHGLFLESIDGRLRFARALSAFIEAKNVSVAASGGVKNDRVRAETKSDDADGKRGGAKEGFGNVPFHREEYTAQEITAFFSLDLEQIRGFGLPPEGEHLLVVLALYKMRALLDGALRLRTACDLAVKQGYAFLSRGPASLALPSRPDLEAALGAAIRDCTARELFAPGGGITTVTFKA